MTDKEIIERLKKADALLKEYIEVVTPAAKALANIRSLKVMGKRGCYDGDLGCYEEGKDSICLHIKDKYSTEAERRRIKRHKTEQEMREKYFNGNGIRYVQFGSHW